MTPELPGHTLVVDDPFDDEPPEPLSIGAVLGGPSTPWESVIKDLGERVAIAREGVESPLNLNVVFHVPGSILQFEGDYVRTGSFDRERRLLMVQATVPGTPPVEADAFAHARLRAAVDCAEAWAKRRQIADDLSALRRLVERIEV